jgi:hypothetical protein
MILHEVLPLFTGQEMVNDILRPRRKFHRPEARCIKVPTLDDQLEEYGKNFDPRYCRKENRAAAERYPLSLKLTPSTKLEIEDNAAIRIVGDLEDYIAMSKSALSY